MRRFRAAYLLTGVLLLHGPVSGASHGACVRSEAAHRYRIVTKAAHRYRRCKSNPLKKTPRNQLARLLLPHTHSLTA